MFDWFFGGPCVYTNLGGSMECKADGTWTDEPRCVAAGAICGVLVVSDSNQADGASGPSPHALIHKWLNARSGYHVT